MGERKHMLSARRRFPLNEGNSDEDRDGEDNLGGEMNSSTQCHWCVHGEKNQF